MAVALPKLPIVSARESVEYLCTLFYGDSGVGKTVLGASADKVPEMHPVLLVDFPPGDGTLSISDTDVAVLHATSINQLFQVERLIRTQVAQEDPNRYLTVFLDDIDMLYMLMLRERMRLEASKPGRDAYVPWQEDWLHGTFRMRGIIARFKALPVHFICSTLAVLSEDKQTGVIHRWPLLPGKLVWEIGRYFDVVGHLTVKASPGGQKLDRYLQVQPYALTSGKSRIPGNVLGSRITNPTMQIIYDAWRRGIAPGKGGEVEEEEESVLPSDSTVTKEE